MKHVVSVAASSPMHLLVCAGLAWSALGMAMHAKAAPATVRPAITQAAGTVVAAPAAPLLKLKGAESLLSFTARQIGVPMEGRFTRYDAQIRLDPKRPETGQVQVSIDMGSVALGAEEDAMLKEGPWFHTAKFPKATFVSQQIRQVAPGRLEVAGTFTLKGVAKPLVVPVALTASGGDWVAKGKFNLPRLSYQVGVGEWADINVIANDVAVQFSWTLQPVAVVK